MNHHNRTTPYHLKASVAQTHQLATLKALAIDYFVMLIFFCSSNFAAVSFESRWKHAKHVSQKLIAIRFLDRGSFFSSL